MLSQLDKFLIAALIMICALESGVDGVKAINGGEWLWATVCLIACVYTFWLGTALVKHFFPANGLPVK